MDKSLDELVKDRPKGHRGGRGGASRGRGGGGDRQAGGFQGHQTNNFRSGPMRRGRGRKQSPYSRPGTADAAGHWSHDLYQHDERPAQRRFNNEQSGNFGTKVKITQLRFDVLEDELKELFASCGTVLTCKVFYDKSGRSEGKGEVVFKTHGEAERAVREYNGRMIDGEAMNVEIAGSVPLRAPVERKTSGMGGMRSDNTEFTTRIGRQHQEDTSGAHSMDLEDSDLTNLKIRVSF